MSDSRELYDPSTDPFFIAGNGGGTSGGGALLLYSKGEYNIGIDRVVVPLGTKIVGFLPGVRHGYRKWVGSAIAGEEMHLVVEQPRMPARNTLGDTDRAFWEAGRDPWQETIAFDAMMADGEKYTLPLSGVGGVRAGRLLIQEYAKARRGRPGQLPLIELRSDSYQHPQYGKVHFPVLPIVGWVDEDSLEPVEDVGGDESIPFEADASPPTRADGSPVPGLKSNGKPPSAREALRAATTAVAPPLPLAPPDPPAGRPARTPRF